MFDKAVGILGEVLDPGRFEQKIEQKMYRPWIPSNEDIHLGKVKWTPDKNDDRAPD